ncbi:MAG: VTT domain-containing protein [Clostridiales Family XIII bacterium]|jgi:uncharacterized membrane protein YdjX (TVP38/TMEM64 family)|nr:VTT domain-containing protein [Clostridiales Family XIII bacterium]
MNKINFKDKAFLKFAALIFFIIIIPALILIFNPDILATFRSIDKFKSFLSEYKEYSYLIYIALQIIQVVITILPQQFTQFAGGYFFGIFQTIILSLIGMIIGTFISYYLGKLLGTDFFRKLLGEFNFEKYKYYLNEKKSGFAVALVYIIPGFPKDIFAYIAGINRMNLWKFILISTIARLPGVIVSIAAGELLVKKAYLFLIIIGILVIIIFIILFLNREKLINKFLKK